MSIENIIQESNLLRKQIATVIEYPEPAMKLDLESRANDEKRQFKHLHQMAVFHSENYVISNKIKLITLIDAYISLYESKNSLGLYNIARSILELAAFINDITNRLLNIYDKSQNSWKSKGQEFFSLMIRARYGTSDKIIKETLLLEGFSKKNLDPINIMSSINTLMKTKSAKGLLNKYDMLCDYVHHNLSSQFISSSGSRVDNIANSSGGGKLIMLNSSPINRYEYPNTHKLNKALKDTENIVLISMKICIEKLDEMPKTPFDTKQIKEYTGSELGINFYPPKQ